MAEKEENLALAPIKHGYFWIAIPMADLTSTLLEQIKKDIANKSGVDNPTIYFMARTEPSITNDQADIINSLGPVTVGGNSYGRSASKGTPPGGNSL